MIPVSNAFKEAMANGQRNWIEEVDITLKSGSVLHLTNADIWGGTLTINDAVSAANNFGAIGSAIINSAKFTMNNIYDDYSPYDFLGATVVIWIGLDLDGTIEKFRKGTYTVDDAQYNGDLIAVECVDNMSKFDVPYSKSTLAYPATLYSILQDVCSVCNVTLNTHSFPQMNFQVANRPNEESVTCREVVSWVATIAGCFARCDTLGRLELGWYDQDSLEAEQNILDGGVFDSGSPKYVSGDVADGGDFNPWNIGYEINIGGYANLENIHNIYSVFSHNISTDDVVITGVKAQVKVSGDSYGQDLKEYVSGRDGYMVELQSTNEFITTSNAQSVVNAIGNKIIGMKFRKLDASILSNPTIEAGDVAFFWDSRTRQHFPIVISETAFTVGNAQKVYSHASTPAKNSAARYSEATKDYVALRKDIIAEKTERELALEELANRLAATNGLYTTTQNTGSGNVYYLHNHPNLADSDIIWKMNAEAWGVSTDGGRTWNAGMTVDGDTIVRILTATGVNADWINAGTINANLIKTGTLKSKDGKTSINLDTGGVTIKGYVTAAALSGSGTTTINGANITTGTINASKIKGGTLKVGGASNGNGVLEVYNSSDQRVGRWDNGALYIGNIVSNLTNPNTKITTAGAITTNSLTAKKYVYVDGNKTSLFKIPFGNTDTDYLSLSSSGLNIKYQTCTVSGGRAGDASGVYSYGLILRNNTSSSTYRSMTLTPSVFNVSETVGSNSYGLSYQKNLFSFSATGGGFNCNATRLYVSGNLAVTGTKNRQVKTDGYGDRLLYAYETASPLFGDVGEGKIAEDGKCYVQIDSIFAETVTLNQYQVFLQKYGDGDCWVSERKASYFVVEGTAGLSFGWELKAKQSDYTQQRLDRDVEFVPQQNSRDYGEELENHIQEIAKEREVAT